MAAFLIIPILSIIGFSLFHSRYLKLDIKKSFPVVISASVILLYFMASIGVLFYATILYYIAGLSCFYLIYKADPEFLPHIKARKNQILFFLFIIISAALFYKGSFISLGDDFKAWATSSKQLLYRHKFENNNDFTSLVGDYDFYPRGAAIFHYLILLPYGFSEGAALFAQFLIYFCLITPFFDKKNLYTSLIFVNAILALAASISPIFYSLYNEITLGLLLSSFFVIYLESNNNENSISKLIPIIAAMPLFHHNGIIVALIGISCFGIYHIKYVKNTNLYSLSKSHLKIITVFSSALTSYFLYLSSAYFHLKESFPILNIDFSLGISDLYNFGNFLKILFKSVIKEGAIALYCLIFVSLKLIKKSDDEALYKNHVALLKLLSYGLISFVIYAFITRVLLFKDPIYMGGIRYFSSFILVFGAISIYYIAKLLEFQKLAQKFKIFFVVANIIAISTTLLSFSRVPVSIPLEEEIYLSQLRAVRSAIDAKKIVEFNYDNKERNLDCYIFGFNMAGKIDKSELYKCFEHKTIHHNVYVGKYIKIPLIEEENCHLQYKPFLLNYEKICKEETIPNIPEDIPALNGTEDKIVVPPENLQQIN